MSNFNYNNQPYICKCPFRETEVLPWSTAHEDLVGPCAEFFNTNNGTNPKKLFRLVYSGLSHIFV